MLFTLTLAMSLLSAVVAQQPVWGQCGGIGWTGGKTCVAGSTCTVSNPYYSQCLPGGSGGGGSPTTVAPPPPPTTTPKPPTSGGANYWFSFGDSYTQTGFLITGTKPAPGNPLGNPPYPGFTAVGGVNWVDVVTTVNNRSLVLTYNFAYGGATIDANLVTPFQPTVQSLTDQINSFLNTVGNKPASTPWTSSNTLFSIFIGINDIGNAYGKGVAFTDTLLNAYFALVQKLVNVGARNFLFVNVPPIDRSPLMLAQAASSQAAEKTVIAAFNSKLATRISSFKSSNSGVTTFLWDSNASFTTYLNNPTAYGFSDATSFGQAKSFWGNNYHPSSAAHVLFGKNVASALGNSVW